MITGSRSTDLGSTLAPIVACLAFGGAIGWMAAALFATETGAVRNGFGAASVALLIGGLAGATAGVDLARDMSPRARWWSTGIALLLAAGTLWSLDLTAR